MLLIGISRSQNMKKQPRLLKVLVVLATVPYRTGEKHKTALSSDALGLGQI